MKTADYSRCVTPVILLSERVLKSKIQDKIELHAVPRYAFFTVRTTEVLTIGAGRA